MTAIQKRFSNAATTYDTVAQVQKESAEYLSLLLQRHVPHWRPNTILDLGAGTGAMSRVLLNAYPNSAFTLNDLSPHMLAQAQNNLSSVTDLKIKLGDFEKITIEPHDLIISNLAFQWANDLAALVARYTPYAQVLAYTTLLDGTFSEWYDALNIQHAIYPSLAHIKTLGNALPLSHRIHAEKSWTLTFPTPRDFMRYLQQLGATHTVHSIPLSLLKKLNRQKEGVSVTYHIYFGVYVR